MNDLFKLWEDHPPTNILVKALVEGFGGGVKKKEPTVNSSNTSLPYDEVFERTQQNAIVDIVRQAGNSLPTIIGKDPGLPSQAPVFDLDEMRRRNQELIAKRTKGSAGSVG